MGSQRAGHDGSDLAHTHQCRHPEEGAAPSRFQERRHMQVLRCSAVSVWNLSTGYRVFLIWRSGVFAERSGSNRWGNELQPASQIHSQAKGSRCPPRPRCARHVPVPPQLSSCVLYLARNSDLLPWVHQVYNAVTQKLLHMVNICMYNQKTLRRQFLSIVQMHFYCIFLCVCFLWGSVLAMGKFLLHPQIPAPRLVRCLLSRVLSARDRTEWFLSGSVTCLTISRGQRTPN